MNGIYEKVNRFYSGLCEHNISLSGSMIRVQHRVSSDTYLPISWLKNAHIAQLRITKTCCEEV